MKDKLYVSDYVTFHTIKDVLNTIFGKEYKSCQKSFWKINILTDNPIKYMSAPKLSKKTKDGELTSQTNSWLNELSDDWNSLYESMIDHSNLPDLNNELKQGHQRAIFLKYKNSLGDNGYRFIGVYKLSDNDNPQMREYKRVAEEITIVK
ncbi:MAG: hypothetical protein ACRQFF_04035 [Sphaerochaeta sp.]